MVKYLYSMISDWEMLRERYCALWDKKLCERGFIAQIQDPSPHHKGPEGWMKEPEENYLNPERPLRIKETLRGAWQWHHDLFQYEIPSYGPNIFIGLGKLVLKLCGNIVKYKTIEKNAKKEGIKVIYPY